MADDRDERVDEVRAGVERAEGAGAGSLASRVTDAGGVVAAIDGAGGEEGDDVADGLAAARTGASVAQGAVATGRGIAGAVQGAGSGDVGGVASGVGGAVGGAGGGVGALTSGIGSALPEGSEARAALGTASSVASTVGQVGAAVGALVDAGDDLFRAASGQRQDVRFHLEVQGVNGPWRVLSASLHEALGELSSARVEATISSGQHVEEPELLALDAGLVIERGDERRSFRGIVRHAHVRRGDGHDVVQLDLTPALWLAAETLDSRIYQGLTVPDLVEELVRELLGDRRRTVRRELTERYLPHEYLVQHRESHWEFLKRICEEEGIFLYFDHDEEEVEVLVLGDSNDDRPRVRPDHDGVVPYEPNHNHAEGREVATGAERMHVVAATDATVRGYDWSNPGLSVHHERVDRGEHEGPRLERYHHDHATRHHEYDEGGQSYRSHTAERYARLHTERLDVRRNACTISTTVVTAMPGHVFELRGHDRLDGRYLIVSVSAAGGTRNGEDGGYHNTLSCVPADVPYRPPTPARRRMPGPETAIVVGPPGQEIHTDPHGRIKVQFHWDRLGSNDERSSAWIRVNQGWAGPGYGHLFVPRIGMEVIVAFLGGDPDRPLVMGAVYNGENRPPEALPDEATRSMIRTQTVHGEGYNELSFEDAAGSEEVHLRAQRNLRELVLNDHSTHVLNDQRNIVDNDQEEEIGGDQKMNVAGDRTHHVGGHERHTVDGYRSLTIKRYDQQRVHEYRDVEIHEGMSTYVHQDEVRRIGTGLRQIVEGGGWNLTVTGGVTQSIQSGGWTMTTTGDVNHEVLGGYSLRTNGDAKVMAIGAFSVGARRIALDSQTEIAISAPDGINNVTPARDLAMAGEVFEFCRERSSASSVKLGAYGLALTLYETKIDMVDMKVDIAMGKVDQKDLSFSAFATQLCNTAAVRIARSPLTLWG